MKIPENTVTWLKQSKDGYARYKAGELFNSSSPPRDDLIHDAFIRENINFLKRWEQEVLTRHDKADLLIHRLALLSDSGIKATDPGMKSIIQKILEKKDEYGIPLIKIKIPKVFGGEDKTEWMWTLCDFPLILYAIQKLGVDKQEYSNALSRLQEIVDENGYCCLSSKPKFKGPGARTSICPYGNLLAAKALGVNSLTRDSVAAKKAVKAILYHWEVRKEKKFFLFGMGTDFKKIKYPMIWYNLLHVVDTISLFPAFHNDKGFLEMWELLLLKADNTMCFTAESIYRAYKDQDFSNKRGPSPTITLRVYEIAKRLGKLHAE
ncbi:MAG: hypothetical protein JXB88_11165 [Spirochaetales bacterium]|nr:hypothetical protein [Spirochaetales bacterium]